MKPILFDSDETNFTSNGLGRLECISCVVTEERNGAYELEMEIALSGNHASEIGMNSIIGVIPHDDGDIQAFRVYEISKPINQRFTVYARHISYDLIKIPTMPFSVATGVSACADTLAGLKSHAVETCPFDFWTDVTTAAPYNQAVPASIRQRLGGVEGSVLDQFGGEYEWDNFTVKLYKQRGRINTGIVLRYGKNITDIEQEENIANTVTGVVPFWTDMDNTDVVTLSEKAVYSQYAQNYPIPLTEVLDLSGKWENRPSENSLRLAAQAFVNQSGLGLPKVSIEVSFIDLQQTEEYKDIAPLQTVQLCDEITVQFEKLGISETAKIVKTVYDVLAERYKSVQVGNLRSTLVSTLNEQNAATLDKISTSMVQAADAIDKSTAWLTGSNGYLMAVKNTDGSWKELLAMDTNDPDTATKVMRLNENGLGGSSSGILGPYLSAILSDGSVVATRINTGILSDLNDNFILDLDNGTLTIGGGTSIGDTNVSAMLTQISTTASGLTSEVARATNAENALNSLYSGRYVPTPSNSPASSWNTTDLKNKHLNDQFANTNTGDLYMWKQAKAGVILTFNPQCQTESTNLDYVRIYYYDSSSGTYKYSKNYGGKGSSNNLANLKLFVPTNTFYIYWRTDGSVTDWGFKVDVCEVGASEESISSLYPNSANSLPTSITNTITGTSTMPETDHPYTNNQTKLWQWNTQISVPSGDYQWVRQSDFSTMYSQIKQTADQISLKVSKGDVSSQLSVETGQITLSSGRLIISAGNFQLDANGNMTCTNANIKGTITLGGSNNTNGSLTLYNASSAVACQLDNNGLLTQYNYYGTVYKTLYNSGNNSIQDAYGNYQTVVNSVLFYQGSSVSGYLGLNASGHVMLYSANNKDINIASANGISIRSKYNLTLAGTYGNLLLGGNPTIEMQSSYLKLSISDLIINKNYEAYGYTGTINGAKFICGICVGWD